MSEDRLKVVESFKVLDAQGEVTYENNSTAHQMKLVDVIKVELAQLEGKKTMLLAQLEELSAV